MKRGQRFKKICEKFKETMEIVEQAMEEEFDEEIDYYDRQSTIWSDIPTTASEEE